MFRVDEIAKALGGRFSGDGSLTIRSASEPKLCGADYLAIALTKGFQDDLSESDASVALLPEGCVEEFPNLDAAIFVERGRLAMSRLTAVLTPDTSGFVGVHATALVADTARIAENVSIGAYTTIGKGVEIGAGTVVGSHAVINDGVVIGASCHIQSGVRLLSGVRIGDRAHLHPNVVVGSDGFSFVTTEPAPVERARTTLGEAPVQPLSDPAWRKIHSLGGVRIGNDVEIGANSTVDAGTLRPTEVGNGTKLDNLVQVGHNVVVGEHCLLCAQAGIAGSSRIGDRTVVGGKAGVADNISIGKDVVIGGGSVVLSNVPDGRVMLGYPAQKMSGHIESYKALRRLPRLLGKLTAKK